MNNKKIILYVIISIFILLLILGSFDILKFNKVRENSSGIPEECRKPEGQSLEQWKEHLGHYQNTLYCLDYLYLDYYK